VIQKTERNDVAEGNCLERELGEGGIAKVPPFKSIEPA